MSDKSAIEWTDATWNPTTGCEKISQGCKHCYAERQWPRLSANPKATKYFARAFTDVLCHEDVLDQPLRWTRPRKIFVNSMSDLFHPAVPFEFIDRVFAVMALTTTRSRNNNGRHIFQVLTKRPARMVEYLLGIQDEDKDMHRWADAAADIAGGRYAQHCVERWDWPLPNVWLGVSAEDQATANERIPLLLKAPAAVRWVSAEPLLGPIDLTWEDRADGMVVDRFPAIDWLVVGGESGPKARAMHPEWVRSLRDQCVTAGVAFHFKQWGEWAGATVHGDDGFAGGAYVEVPGGKTAIDYAHNWRDGSASVRVGKKVAGRELDGRTWDEYPWALAGEGG